MIKPFFNQILPRMHLIINFVLLHYDQKNTYLTNLMLIILKCFKDCPESLTKIFALPTSLIWPFELQTQESMIDGTKEFTEADITLQLFAKDSIFVDSFVRELVKFICPSNLNGSDSNDKDLDQRNSLINNWGRELVEWICGCGDLLLSARASYIFSAILRPMSDDIIKYILRSFCIVVKNVNKEDLINQTQKTINKSQTPPPSQQLQPQHQLQLQHNSQQTLPMKNVKSDSVSSFTESLSSRIKNSGFLTLFSDKSKNAFKPKLASNTVQHKRSVTLNGSPRLAKVQQNTTKTNNMISNRTLTYIISVLNLFSNYMNIFKTDENFETVFTPVYKIAFSFLLVSNKNKNWAHSICDAVLPIITKFIIHSNNSTEKLKLNKLVLLLSSLIATLKSRDLVYAVFLAIFKYELENPDSQLAKSSLIIFINFIYIALSAYHNIPPFSSEMSNSEIAKVFECVPLIATGKFVSSDLKSVLLSVFNDPASMEPDEFIIKAMSSMINNKENEANNNKAIFIDASEYLEKIVKSSDQNSALQVSIFAVVASIFKAAENFIDEDFMKSFSSIVLIAANNSSQTVQSKELIQFFLQNMAQKTDDVPKSIPKMNFESSGNYSNEKFLLKDDEPKLFEKWGSVIRKVDRYTNAIAPISANMQKFINEPILIVPLNCWNSDISKEIRNLIKIVRFNESDFELREKLIREQQQTQNNLLTLSLDNFDPPTELAKYTAYLTPSSV